MSLGLQQQIRNNATEIRSYIQDLYDWEEKVTTKAKPAAEPSRLPPVRGQVDIKQASQQAPTKVLKRDANTVQDYYKAWETFNVDKELEILQEEEKEVFQPFQQTANQQPNAKLVIKGGRQSNLDSELVTLKGDGNKKYSLGDYLGALKSYADALSLLTAKSSLSEEETQLLVVLHSNSAQCHLHLSDYVEAQTASTLALNADPTHVKSLQRRATARKRLGKLKLALRDFEAAALQDPAFKNDVKQIQAALHLQKQKYLERLQCTITEEQMRTLRPVKVQDVHEQAPVESQQETVSVEVPDERTRTITFGGVTYLKSTAQIPTHLKSCLKQVLKYKPGASSKDKAAIQRSLECYDFKGLKSERIDGKLLVADEAHKELLRSIEEKEGC